MTKLPRANEAHTKIGWTLCTDLTDLVSEKIRGDGWEVTPEVVEIAMLEAEKLLAPKGG